MSHPPPQAHPDLLAIRAMLSAGHRSVRLERHTLLLIGGVGGFVAASTEYVITDQRFPELLPRAFALLLWLAFWLGGMAVLDQVLTQRRRRQRDETLPFAQAQVTRAWWMLLAMGILGTFAMSFHGGGSMVYALWIVLLGLGMYLFGLFSRRLIEWIGLGMVLMGAAALAAGLPYGTMHWLATACFALGMPAAGWLSQRWGDAAAPQRILALLAWLLLVIVPSLAAAHAEQQPVPAAPLRQVNAPDLMQGEKVLRLERGSAVDLTLELHSPLIGQAPGAALPLSLSLPVEVALNDGVPDGRYRVADGPWHRVRDGVLNLRIYRVEPRMLNGRPSVQLQASFEAQDLAQARP
jgi:hypothetical protein